MILSFDLKATDQKARHNANMKEIIPFVLWTFCPKVAAEHFDTKVLTKIWQNAAFISYNI